MNPNAFLKFQVVFFGILLSCAAPLRAADSDLTLSMPVDPGSFVDDIIVELMQEEELAGAGVALVYQGQPAWSSTYGLSSENPGLKLTIETPNALHELAQLFTAVGVMQLVEAGQLDLDAPFNRYISGFTPFAGAVSNGNFTIRQLLSHHSGLPAFYAPGSGREGNQADTTPFGYRSVLADSASIALVATPGTVYEYSYLGYTLLGLLIEKISGQDFADYMQSRIIAPLNLQHTGFVTDPDMVPGIATAYVNDDTVPHRKFRDLPAAGLVSSMQDMAIFMQALLTGGQGLLTSASLEEMFRPQNTGVLLDENFSMGLGVFITPVTGGTFHDLPSASHASTDGVARAYMLAFPQYRLGVILATNSRLSSVKLRDTVDRIMERMLVSATGFTPTPFVPHLTQNYSSDKVQGIAGAYGGPGGTYFVVPEKNSLKLEVPYIPFISVNLLPRADDYYGVELRFLCLLKVPGVGQLQLLANSVEGKVLQINGNDMLYWYWRGVAVVSLTRIKPAEPSTQLAWRKRVGDYRSDETGMNFRFNEDKDSGAFTFGPYERGFKLFREPPEIYCAKTLADIKSCGLGLVGNGSRNVLRVLDDGRLLSAYGESYTALP